MLTHGVVLCVRLCVSRCLQCRLNNITEGLGDNTESAPARRNRWCAVLLESGLGEGATICLPSLSQGLLPQISSDGSGGVAPAWHVTLLLDVSLPRSVKAEA